MKKISRIFVVLFLVALSLFSVSAFAEEARPRLGIAVAPLQASPILLQHLRLSEGEGLMVSNIAVGGELESAGLSQGDILLAIDGHALSRPEDLEAYVSKLPKGHQVSLDVIQKGEHRQIIMKLDSLPDEVVWKYLQPSRDRRAGMFGQMPMVPRGSSQVPQAGGGQYPSQRMMFKSLVQTDKGVVSSTVTIQGSPDDPDSEITVSVGNDEYKTRIGDIEQLPDAAREAARRALDQSGNFSFSFGFGGDSLFEEMMRRQQEQMRMMDEFFNRQYTVPERDSQQPQGNPKLLTPVDPSGSPIRS
ncbi:MAG: PDZ domain-containing protein [Proteobacteria bacterium]|nr:PDZ domain-containing protein [Pseudomonadota bacterium]MBQ9244338.1 PDZ domain-containing protein [Pseudomonadota bacterium]